MALQNTLRNSRISVAYASWQCHHPTDVITKHTMPYLIARGTHRLDVQQHWICQGKLHPAGAWMLSAPTSKTGAEETEE